MERLAYAVAAALVLAGCGGGAVQASPAPARTTAAPAAAAPVVLKATLSAAEQTPPITTSERTCEGTGTVTLDPSALTVKFNVTVRSCPADTELTEVHVHKGANGANGGIVIDPKAIPADLKLTAGAGTFTKTASGISAPTIADVIADPASFYLNVHSRVNGGGVTRGQLSK